MSVRGVLTRLLPGNEINIVVECRQCGTSLEPDSEDCPDCGAAEIVQYRIPQ